MMNKRGFTIIEIIVTLLIVGIAAVVAAMSLVTAVKGYSFAQGNAAITEKAQLAMNRISRECLEIIDIPNPSSRATATSLVYERLSGSTIRAFSFGQDGDTIKIAEGAQGTIPDFTSGDILVKDVASLFLDYYQGSDPWAKDDVQLLSSIAISLVMDHPGSDDDVTFSTVVSPRNNDNFGGNPPTTEPPSKPGYCFIATAAFGNYDHPVVRVLRDVRDHYLMTWKGGQTFVDWYYKNGETISQYLEGHDTVRGCVRACLIMVAGAAALMMTHGIATALLIVLCVVIIGMTACRGEFRRRRGTSETVRARGSVIVAVVLIMMVMGIIGAALLPLFSTSTMSQLGGSFAKRAYYLAEGGYRYVFSEYLNAGTGETAKDDRLEAIHGQKTYTLSGNDGLFEIEIYPYYFKTTADPVGSTVLSAKIPGGFPPDLTLTSGYLKIADVIYEYSSSGHTGSNVSFTRTGGNWPSIDIDETVHLVSYPDSSQTVTDANNFLDLETVKGSAASFPRLNGSFKVGGGGNPEQVWSYKSRNGNRLRGIESMDDPGGSFSLDVTTANSIELQKFVRVKSTGVVDSGTGLETCRTISYYTPIGWLQGQQISQKVTYHETFDDTSAWFEGGEQGEVGDHEVQSIGYDNALAVTDSAWISGSGEWSVIQFNWGQTSANLNSAWEKAGKLLSYDLQVKMHVDNEPFYMGGMLFRTETSGSDLYCYGLSFMRARQSRFRIGFGWSSWFDSDYVPSDLKPSALWEDYEETGGFLWQDRYSQPAIVLWHRNEIGYRWLAYEILDNTDHVVTSSDRLENWSMMQMRICEGYPLPFRNGGPDPLLHGEIVTGQVSGATGRVNATPVLTSGTWESSSAAGRVMMTNIDGTFIDGENLLVDSQVTAVADWALSSRTNYIRVYYGDVDDHLPADAVPTNNLRKENDRVTGGQTINWPVSDVSAWSEGNDYMTLVQWDAVNSGVTLLGTGSEESAVIDDDDRLSPEIGEVFDRSEIAIHTSGDSSTSIAFDDFAIQVEIGTGEGEGFLPPIQQ